MQSGEKQNPKKEKQIDSQGSVLPLWMNVIAIVLMSAQKIKIIFCDNTESEKQPDRLARVSFPLCVHVIAVLFPITLDISDFYIYRLPIKRLSGHCISFKILSMGNERSDIRGNNKT